MIELLKRYDEENNKNVKDKLINEINVEYPENARLFNSVFSGSFKKEIIDKIDKIDQYLKIINLNNIESLELSKNELINNCHCKKLIDQLNVLSGALIERKSKDTDEQSLRSDVTNLYYTIDNIVEYIESKIIIVNGDGATGKTHLLTKLNKDLLDDEIPSIIFYGQNTSNIASFIKNKMNIESEQFFKNAVEYAKENETNFVIIFDALNEVDDDPKIILNELKALSSFENFKIIISYRNGYIDTDTYSEIKTFPTIQLYGFSDEVEAAIKFGELYNIEVNEILETSFTSNPLMLRYFCEAYNTTRYSKNKEIIKKTERGALAATFFFENAFKLISSRIIKELGIKKANGSLLEGKNFWNNVGKGIAKVMIDKSRTYLYHYEMVEFLNCFNLNMDSIAVINSMQVYKLIEKKYIYDEGQYLEGYKFTFQKLSDYLLARELLSRKDTTQTWSEFINQSWILKLLEYNMSIIESLVEWIPIRTGQELFEILKYDSLSNFEIAYIKGLRYRSLYSFQRVDNYQSKILEFIKKYSSSEYFGEEWNEAIYSCLLVPYHPLNCINFLNERLFRMSSNIDRDIVLKEFFYGLYSNDKIIAQLKMTTYADINRLSDDFLLNYISFCFWLLSLSNRSFRDKATGSLVLILKKNLKYIKTLWNLMIKVSDEYIIERVFAIIYAANVLNPNDKILEESYKKVKDHIYNNTISNARIIHFFLLMNKLIISRLNKYDKLSILDLPKIDLNIVIKDQEEWKKMSLGVEYNKVQSSLYNGIADFGNYIASSRLESFINEDKNVLAKIKKDIVDFEKSLTEEQHDYYIKRNEYNSEVSLKFQELSNGDLVNLLSKLKTGELQNDFNSNPSNMQKFKNSLSKEMLSQYEELFPKLDSLNNKSFDRLTIATTIYDKMIKMGYCKAIEDIDEQYSHFERSYDRHGHRIERLGKKYEWIAFFQFLGECLYNLDTKDNSWRNYHEMISIDIDPIQVLANPKQVYDFYDIFENIVKKLDIDWSADNFITNYDNLNLINNFYNLKFNNKEFLPIHISAKFDKFNNEKDCYFRYNLALNQSRKEAKDFLDDDIYHLTQGQTHYEYNFCLEELLKAEDELYYQEEINKMDFKPMWKECKVESEYNFSRFNGEDQWHYYLLSKTITDILEIKYNYDGTYRNQNDELVAFQSPFVKEYTYLYLEKSLFEKINAKLNLIIGVYSEKSKRNYKNENVLGDFEIGSEYDAGYKYSEGIFKLEKLRKRERRV